LRLAVRQGIGAAFAHDVVDPGLQRRRHAEVVYRGREDQDVRGEKLWNTSPRRAGWS
jgi:hypothetical protein